MQHSVYFSNLGTPGFVDNIRSEATQSKIKISWSAPTTSLGEMMDVDHYYLKYMCVCEGEVGSDFEYFVKERIETEFEVSDLDPCTFTLSMIAAEYQGKIGPEVCIAISTGNICMLPKILYIHFYVYLFENCVLKMKLMPLIC